MATNKDYPVGVRPAPANPWLFWGIISLILISDFVTKAMAVDGLLPQHTPHEILGDYLRLTLVYNPGAAFGLNLGPMSRWIFMALSFVALIILGRLYKATEEGNYLRAFALGLVCGGAAGNLVDRLRSGMGVVDFIDVGVGVHRWPTFNVADMAVSTGAVLLAWVLLKEDRVAARVVAAGER